MPAIRMASVSDSVSSSPANARPVAAVSMAARPWRSARRPKKVDANMPTKYTTKMKPMKVWLSENGGSNRRKPT
ncbi:hypothetical protein D3C86_2195470 [compost metagenome]